MIMPNLAGPVIRGVRPSAYPPFWRQARIGWLKQYETREIQGREERVIVLVRDSAGRPIPVNDWRNVRWGYADPYIGGYPNAEDPAQHTPPGCERYCDVVSGMFRVPCLAACL